MKDTTTDEERSRRVVTRYQAGESFDAIAASEHMGTKTVGAVLRRAGVVIRPVGHPRVYPYDAAYFAAGLDEARAYWLGFLFADGCVMDGNRLSITLAERDAGHLYALRDALKAGHPVTVGVRKCGYASGGGMASFTLRCHRLAADLARYGVVPRKSGVGVPPSLPEAVQRHFWRGVLDGNGFISVTRGMPTVGITGSLATCEAFGTWVRHRCPTAATTTTNHSIWTFAVNGRNVPGLLLDTLYTGASIALARKAVLAADVIAARQEWLASGGTPRVRRSPL